jgi:hypothetical protein
MRTLLTRPPPLVGSTNLGTTPTPTTAPLTTPLLEGGGQLEEVLSDLSRVPEQIEAFEAKMEEEEEGEVEHKYRQQSLRKGLLNSQ